ncbi:MAG: hypothetical protein ACYS99_00565, partial [Planctomycetota bacterium]
MSSSTLNLEAAEALRLDDQLLRLLAPEEVAKHAVLPLELDREESVVRIAVDPTASQRTRWFLKMRCDVRRVEAVPASREAVAYLLTTHFLPYWSERGWGFPGLLPVSGEGRRVLALAPAPRPDPESEEDGPAWSGTEDAPPDAPPLLEPAAAPGPPAPAETELAAEPEHVPAAEPETLAAPPPAPEPAEEAAGEDVAETLDSSHPVVLVVETGRVRCRALAGLLEEAGYEPRFAATRDDVE